MPRAALLLLLLAASGGCTNVATKSVTFGGKLLGATVSTTAGVAGQAAVTGVQVSGNVAGATAKTAVNTSLDLLSGTATKSVVTVVDLGTGTRKQVPWSKGLTLAGAGQSAQIATVARAIDLIRGAQTIKAAADTLLQAGDVVRVK
jgi:hypothetical protein